MITSLEYVEGQTRSWSLFDIRLDGEVCDTVYPNQQKKHFHLVIVYIQTMRNLPYDVYDD